MVNNSLGLIEVKGFAAALEAADAALKAANVELLGYEFTKGGGLILIKLCGDVGAVKAAVQAGAIAASKINKVLSTLVIPRPSQQLSCILEAGKEKEPQEIQEIQETQEKVELKVDTEIEVITPENPMVEESGTPVSEENATILHNEKIGTDDAIIIAQPEENVADICNLCGDPACQRKKGDPKITCIYYGKKNNKEAE